MKVLVSGGIGHVGKAVAERLVRNGHQVKIIDRDAGEGVAGAEVVQCDINDFPSLRQQVKGQDAIAHLAGIPFPGGAPGEEIFRINASGTYNIFEAAALEGVRRVACASSINALGFNFGIKTFPIQYFPIDEQHPAVTTDPYSFSKQILEEIASYYWRREGISSTCLRMPYVYGSDSEYFQVSRLLPPYRRAFEKLLALPDGERAERVRQLIRGRQELSAKRMFERPWGEFADERFDPEDPSVMVFFGYTDFWSAISAQDAAQAFEKSLLAEFQGSHPLFVNEARNFSGLDSELLARVFFPEVTARKRRLQDAESLVSFERARQVIGFEPEYWLADQVD